MLETPQQILVVMLVLGFFGISLGVLIAAVNARKKFVNLRVLNFILVPLLVLPATVAGTYIIWPSGSINFMLRLLIGIGATIISSLPVLPITVPMVKFIEKKDKENQEVREMVKEARKRRRDRPA